MKTALVFVVAFLAAIPAHAQDLENIPPDVQVVRDTDLQLDTEHSKELKQWLKDVHDYKSWYDTHGNRMAWNVFGGAGTRRERPAVPEWLPEKCDILTLFVPRPAGILSDGCNWLSYYKSNFTVDPAQQQILQAQKQNEEDPHSSFWKHVHLDAGWTSLDPRMHAYGVVGMHFTLPELAKRVQIYLPPGFLLVSLPDGRGGRELQPAATIGVSIKMFQFYFPAGKPGTAYFNLAKAYVINHATPVNTSSSVDLMGLSFSWGR